MRTKKRNGLYRYIVTLSFLIMLAVTITFILTDDRYWEDDWIGFYTPAHCTECEGNSYPSPQLPSLATCKKWAEGIAIERKDPDDMYMCNYKCTKSNDGYVCEQSHSF